MLRPTSKLWACPSVCCTTFEILCLILAEVKIDGRGLGLGMHVHSHNHSWHCRCEHGEEGQGLMLGKSGRELSIFYLPPPLVGSLISYLETEI